ncbi:MAG: sensor domain-containing diguanylate cyclase [Myxococcales bacterium]|nr:sensor domain-containing diguanylate cyclase [Myxococcales bacterium]
MPRRLTPQLAFTFALTALGWSALIAQAIAAGGVLGHASPLSFAGFVLVVAAARALAFRVGPSVLSLDSAFYVAAAVAVGPVAGGAMVAVTLAVDALARPWFAPRSVRQTWPARLLYAAYFGGMSGGLLAAIAAGFARLDLSADLELDVIIHVLLVGGAFLVAHNLLSGLRQVLGGQPWRRFAWDQAGPGMLAEGSLLPLAAVLALLYLAHEEVAFVFVCATYLLVNLIFNRLARASHAWRARVRELEQLDHSARELARSIELPHVVATVARQVVLAIPAAETVALIHRGAERDTERFVVDAYDRDRAHFARLAVARGEGAAGRVVATLAPVAIDDLAHSDVDLGPEGTEGVRSWLGVPLFVAGTCEGVLAVQSRAPAAFGPTDQRLLASLALQVGAALHNAHLYTMAMVDGLTGLFVRRYFDARVDEEIERARRYDQAFSIVMIDIDDFKHLNDTHGHLIGDRVLREVAAAVKGELRGVDTAARYGGEELVIILPRTELVAALSLAERIRVRIAERRIAVTSDGPVLSVTASFGIATYPDSGLGSAEDLVRRADRALYRAKRSGKNRVELYWADDSGPNPTAEAAAHAAIH